MQDPYAGDVGDFMKLGLLRHLAGSAAAGGTGLSFAINWYRAPSTRHTGDGKHIAYLRPGNRWHLSLKSCDPDLMPRLAQVVANGRSVEALEASDALPCGSMTHHKMLDWVSGSAGRRAWHGGGLDALVGPDILFADPDNGVHTAPRPSTLHKFALMSELADYATRGQSLVVYQHADRSADCQTQARRRLYELSAGVSQHPVGAVIARRGTCRFFLVTAVGDHRDRLATSLRHYIAGWSPHAELVC
jgi:hypothetical protein